MTFSVDWDPSTFYREQEYTDTMSFILAHAITLTGTGNNVQAATCINYMGQTWPETGKELLQILQKALENGAESICRGKTFNTLR